MNTTNDPVKDALKSLRSRQWSGDPLNIELEEKLMEQFQSHNAGSRRVRHRTVAVALATVLICSVGFAAVKYDTIKTWLVQLEINGEVVEVELTQVSPDEAAEASLTIDTPDGEADVSIKRWESEDGSQGRMEVVVKKDDGSGNDTQLEEVIEHVISDGGGHALLSTEVLGDAEPDAGWQDADGQSRELYIIPGEEGEDAIVYMLIDSDALPDPLVSRIGSIPADLLADGVEPEVEVDDEGGVTITIGDGDNVNVLKFRTKMLLSTDHGPGPRGLDQALDAGGISITITDTEQDEE